MSGGFVPYHLRQNKSVERAVFIDLLSRLGRSTSVPIHKFTYVGFAGPFSEDFKLVHSHLGISKLISIEDDEGVLRRQKWNAPIKCIQYKKCSAKDYIDEFDGGQPVIIWLDYASAADIGNQIAEAEFLLSKMAPFDILKITVNANPWTLGSRENSAERIATANKRLGAFFETPPPTNADDVDRSGYPKLLLKAIETAMKRGLVGKKDCSFQLLTTFSYADSDHQMLTVTGIVLPVKGANSFLKQTGISTWKLATTKWGNPRTVPVEIGIPEMSMRERLFVDQQMPRTTPKALLKRLGFPLSGGSEGKALKALDSYRRFYRHYPYFSKVVV